MKKLILTAISVIALSIVVSDLQAGEKKEAPKKEAGKKAAADPNAERTVRGVAVCAKCKLGIADSCQNVIQTTRKGKDGAEQKMTFWLEKNDVANAFHKGICSGEEIKVVAKGTVKRDGKKMLLTAASIKEDDGKGKPKKDAK